MTWYPGRIELDWYQIPGPKRDNAIRTLHQTGDFTHEELGDLFRLTRGRIGQIVKAQDK